MLVGYPGLTDLEWAVYEKAGPEMMPRQENGEINHLFID